jgi:hypothetical protein
MKRFRRPRLPDHAFNFDRGAAAEERQLERKVGPKLLSGPRFAA